MARGITAGFGIDLRGGSSFTVRFNDGGYRLEPPGSGPVDCTITADPAAFPHVVGSHEPLGRPWR